MAAFLSALHCKRTQDLTGKIFGRWTVEAFAGLRDKGNGKYRQSWWQCRCECGMQKAVSAHALLSGDSRSCGCLKRALTRGRLSVHGLLKTPEYKVWQNMKNRCLNLNIHNYDNYGGRGIRVCGRWLNSFANFYEDMGPRPSALCTIERIDNDKDYEPSNCRWATRAEQMRNTRNSRYVTFMNKTLCLADWGKELGISPQCLRERLSRGWSIEKTFTLPPKSQHTGRPRKFTRS